MDPFALNLIMILCFIVGSGLIILEAFIPGFGVAGIFGIILEVVALWSTWQLHGVVTALIALLAVLILIPLATHTLNQAYDTLSDAQTTALQAQTALSRVTELSENAQDSLDTLNLLAEQAEGSLDAVDAMIENVNGLVEDNTGALQETIQKLNALDFEKFNNSIDQLNEVIGPLSRLFAR